MATVATVGEGSFETRSLAEVVIDLYRARASGTLKLQRDRVDKSVIFSDGAPVAVRTNVASERLAARLLSAKLLEDRAVAERLDRAIEADGRNEAAALTALRRFDSKKILDILRTQTRSRIAPAFAWSDGRYVWVEGESDAAQAPLRLDPIRLVQQGLAAHSTTERMVADLAPLADQVASPNPSLPALLRRLDRSGALDALLAGLRGETRFDILLGRALRDPKALAGAWVLVRCEALSFSAASEQSGEQSFDTLASEIEIAVVGSGDTAARGARDAEAGGRQKQTGLAEEVRQEILERHSALPAATHYEVLGVAPDAGGSEIKKAYFKVAKRLHPDKLGGMGLEDVALQADELISRINEAHKVLSDPKARDEYDRASREGEVGEIDVARLAQAESFFVKGEVMLRMGDFRSALPLLQNAVDVWPDEAAYQSTLGWALFKKSPSDPNKAIEHLEAALELDPNTAQIHYWQGLVLKALGRTNDANQALARARAIDPSIG